MVENGTRRVYSLRGRLVGSRRDVHTEIVIESSTNDEYPQPQTNLKSKNPK